jgi:hypothetical protein
MGLLDPGEAIEMLLAIGKAGKSLPRRFSVYQLGRGSAPVVVVRRALSFVVVNTLTSPDFTNRKLRCIRCVVELN